MCLRPSRLHLPDHEIRTAREMGWHELENGDLLKQAETSGFDVLLTGDKNLSYQQNLSSRTIALVVLETTRWKVLREQTDLVAAALGRAKPGSFEEME